MTMPLTPSSDPTASWPRRTARAGGVAALLMLLAQLLWRTFWSSPGVPAFPEMVVAAVSQVTPFQVFGWVTENLGSLAQNSLFFGVLLATMMVGREAGELAGRAAARLGGGVGARVVAGLGTATVLLLITGLVISPIARYGWFGLGSRHPAETLAQLVVTFALFGLAWSVLAGPLAATVPDAARVGPAGAGAIDRRSVLTRSAWGGGTLALLAGVGGLGWRLARPQGQVDSVASQEAAREIVATAEAQAQAQAGNAGGAAVTPPPTSAPLPRLGVGDPPGDAVGDAASGPAAPPPTEFTEAEPTVAQPVEQAEATAPVEPVEPTARVGAVAPAAPAAETYFARLEAGDKLTTRLTSVADFYHVSKNISDPVVDGEGWSLTIDGVVERPLTLTYEDLVARATTRKITTLGCISNEVGGDLIGTAEWTGLPLAELLTEVGLRPEAVKLRFQCADSYEDSITIERGLDPDTLVVIGMNGEPLTPDHGYPARLIVPGIYGMKNVKWVERIEAVDFDFQGYWQERGWSDPAPYQTWGRIDSPESGEEIGPGSAVAAGMAAAGDRGVERVEVSLDEGATWADAILEPALNAPFTWVRWVFPFEASDGEYEMRVRVTDGTGEVATEQRRPPLPDGATGWPSRKVRVEG